MENIIKLEESIKREKNKAKKYNLIKILLGEYYNIYRKTKNTKFLDKIIQLSEEIDRRDINVLNILGLAYLEKKEFDNAIKIFNEILNDHNITREDRNTILYNLAIAYFNKGELATAYDILKEISLNSNGDLNILSKRLLAKTCLKLGDVRHIEEAKKILESFDTPTEDLAIAYAALAKYYGSKELLEKAKSIANIIGNKRVMADVLSVSNDENDLKEAYKLYSELNDNIGQIRVLYKLSYNNPSLFSEIIDRLQLLDDSKDKLSILYDLYIRTKIIQFLKEAIKVAEKLNDVLFIARAYAELAKYENEVENLRKAISFYERYVELQNKK
ncbi:MAG: CDC27 family protein [Saccharolobus sp.]